MAKEYFTKAELTPSEIPAGDSVEINVRLMVGKDFSADHTRIIFDLPGYLGQSRPSGRHQEESGCCDVLVSNPTADFNVRTWDMEILDFPTKEKTSWRGMAQRMLVVDFFEGDLQPGDEILLKWGAYSNGFGPGCKVTCLSLTPDFQCPVHVRYFTNGDAGLPDLGRSFKGYDRPTPDAEIELPFRVLPRNPEFMRLIRGPEKATLEIHDRFFNIIPQVEIGTWAAADKTPRPNSHGALVFDAPDIELRDPALPLRVTPDPRQVDGEYNFYFGDIHTHSAFSNDCIEREKMQMTPDDLYAYARESACLDFYAPTDHHQCWDKERNKIGEHFWERTIEAAKKHDDPGHFLAFVGFEFRCRRGDTAVVLKDWPDYRAIDIPEATDIAELWKRLQVEDYLTIPHFHNNGSLDEGDWLACPEFMREPVIEMYSCHGSYEREHTTVQKPPENKVRRPDRNALFLLKKGLRYGFVANSDGHKGHVGRNGLMVAIAKENTRDAIFDALRNRRCYAVTNARIRMHVKMDGHWMGSELPLGDDRELTLDIRGEDRLKAVEVFKNGELIHQWSPQAIDFKESVRIPGSETAFWTVRATQRDNQVAFSSPVWVG